MKLLLAGGGEPDQVKKLDEYFANYVHDGNVLYIPVAMDKIPYEDCEKWFRETYAEYNLHNIDVCTDLFKAPNLDEYKAIFIGGGNTFKLLKEIKESGFDTKIKNYLDNGGFIYGGSAGAIIFGETIETSSHADKNLVGLKDLTGLNLLKGYDVWCHYNEDKDEKGVLELKRPTFVLYEESGLLFDGNKFETIGKEHLVFPNDFE